MINLSEFVIYILEKSREYLLQNMGKNYLC